jgi:hypothetical protein
MIGVKVAYRKPQAAEISRIASKRVNPTVVGFTCSQRKYRNTMTVTMTVDSAKRRPGWFVSGVTRNTLVYFDRSVMTEDNT